MKFILVNGRTPIRTTFCLQCCEKINGNYVREIRTRLPYCDYQCYARHVISKRGRQARATEAS